MDHDRFDGLTRTLGAAASRRTIGRALAGSGLAALLGSALSPLTADAKKNKRKKRKKKPKKTSQIQIPPGDTPPPAVPPLVFNQYGCVEVGQPCRGNNANCCSGICQGSAPAEGQLDQSRCVAHDTGTCRQGSEGICTVTDPLLSTCNNRSNCACFATTAGSNYCAELFNGPGFTECASCQRDADCIALGFPPESACAPVSAGRCAGQCSTGMACLVPCGALSPPPQM